MLNTKKFWEDLDREHYHVNRNYVLQIMRSLNAMNLLTAEGRKVLENLIIEDSKAFKVEIKNAR